MRIGPDNATGVGEAWKRSLSVGHDPAPRDVSRSVSEVQFELVIPFGNRHGNGVETLKR